MLEDWVVFIIKAGENALAKTFTDKELRRHDFLEASVLVDEVVLKQVIAG